MRPKSPWTHAHVKLKRLYDQRVPEGMTQAEFGRLYDIGNQSMVAQYLNGLRPLNYDVAAKFARALKCKIEDFCPEMANTLSLEIFPYLGKSLRRVTILVLALQLGGISPDANATKDSLHNQNSNGHFFANSLTSIHILGLWRRFVKLFKRGQSLVVLVATRTLISNASRWFGNHGACLGHP